MLFRLFLLFTVLPLGELLLLLWVKDHTSWTFTIGLVLCTGLVGASLARWQGWQTVRRIREQTSRGQIPGDALVDGLLIIVAGAVLVTPGILTDLFGFSLLVPPVRSIVKKWLKKRFQHRITVRASRGRRPADPHRDTIIDARFVDPENKAKDQSNQEQDNN